mgnify:CR=1 FL=1
MKVANSFLNKKNRDKLHEFMLALIQDKTEGYSVSTENLAIAASKGDSAIKNYFIDNFMQVWKRIIEIPELAIDFFPFFKIGFSTVRPCLASDSLGH